MPPGRTAALRRWTVACLLGVVLVASAAPDYRFRVPAGTPAVALNDRVLTADERAFIAALPEVRVAVPLPPSRPYEVIAADGEISGIHPDMLVALARTFGIRLKPVVLPDWTRTLDAARRREVDIVMTLGVTAERMEYLAFTLGATPLPGALFARKGARVEPARARYALERNYMANDWVRRQYPDATIVTVETTLDALRAVADQRADVYLGSLLEASDWLARQPVPGVEVNRMLGFGTGYYHFGVRKDWAPLAAILNKGIQSLRSSTGQEITALGKLPPGLALQQPLVLNDVEAALLAHKPVWRVGAVRGLALLNDIDDRGLHSGIAAEYTEQVARRLGVAVQPVGFDTVAAMLDAQRRGEIDLVPFLTRTPQREAEFAFSAPYFEMPYMLVARSDGALYWNLDSLRGKRLALAAQHPLRELLASKYPDVRIVDAANGNDAMDQVLRGEADAAVEVKLFANLRVNGDAGQQLRTVAEVSELPAQFHFATLRSAASLLPLVNRALADIPADERQRMLRRWVATDLRPPFPWRRYAPVIAVSLAALLAIAAGTVWWMRRLRREVLARRRSETLLNDIAATVPGVAFRYVVNADGSVRHHFFTPGAKAFLGVDLDPRRTVLAALGPRLRPDQRAEAEALQTRCMHTGEPFKVTGAYQHPDGRERWLHTEAVQTRSPGGHAVWTGYVVDVSTERELQARLAQEADSRNLMLASASHELRAPTHTLSLALQALPDAGLSSEQQQAVHIARESAHTLSELLNDVLDAARFGSEPLRLRPRTFDLHRLLEDIAGAWRAAARTKGLAFELVIAGDVPRTVMLDPMRLKQVLTNLLSNACKYTHEGQVSLHAARAPGGALQFGVSDTGIGIGIAEDAQSQLFEPFVTLDNPLAGTRLEGSTGLGLSICRRVATLMHGSVALESTPGQGTRATFTLPLPLPLPLSLPPLAGAVATTAAMATSTGRILVCDDDETSRLLLAHMLRRHGFDVVETADGDTALSLWRLGGVRALITDLDLPGLNGLNLIRTVRAEEAGHDTRTPVIVCSGSPVPAADALPAAALQDAYLVKPVEVATLTAALRDLHVVP